MFIIIIGINCFPLNKKILALDVNFLSSNNMSNYWIFVKLLTCQIIEQLNYWIFFPFSIFWIFTLFSNVILFLFLWQQTAIYFKAFSLFESYIHFAYVNFKLSFMKILFFELQYIFFIETTTYYCLQPC